MSKTPDFAVVVRMLEKAYSKKAPALPKCKSCKSGSTAIYTLPRWPDIDTGYTGCRDELKCEKCGAVAIEDIDVINSILSGKWMLYEGLEK